MLGNQTDDLIRVVHSTVCQEQNVGLLLLLWLRYGENGLQGCENLSPAKIGLKLSYLVKCKLEILIVVFNAALVFKEELEFAAVADDLKRGPKCKAL